MNINIRKGEPGDVGFLRKAFHEEKPIIHTFCDEHAWDCFAEFLFETPGISEVLIAENDGERAGCEGRSKSAAGGGRKVRHLG